MDIVTILINNGVGVACAAAMLWLSWFRETRTIPAMLNTFSEAHKRGSDTLVEMTNAMQLSFSERNQKSLETFSSTIREERLLYQQWHEENRGRLETLANEVKENRHLLRNLLNVKTLREEVEKERKGANSA